MSQCLNIKLGHAKWLLFYNAGNRDKSILRGQTWQMFKSTILLQLLTSNQTYKLQRFHGIMSHGAQYPDTLLCLRADIVSWDCAAMHSGLEM